MKDLSFLQISTTLQARGRERERGFEERTMKRRTFLCFLPI